MYKQKYLKYKFKYLRILNNYKISAGGKKEYDIIKKYIKLPIIKQSNKYIIQCNISSNTIFTIEDDHIDLLFIYKCGLIKGKDLLESIINIAKEIKKNIKLYDYSLYYFSDDCSIQLSYFYILMYGISWYNKFGFISIPHDEYGLELPQYDEIICKNEIIINYTLDKFLLEGIIANDNLEILTSDNVIECLHKLNIVITKDTLIKLVIQEIYNYSIKNKLNCKDEIIIILKILIEYSIYLLEYNNELEYIV